MFPNKLASKVPNNIPKNPPFCYFVSLSIALVIPFNKILESSRARTIFILLFISYLKSLKLLFQTKTVSFDFYELMRTCDLVSNFP